MCTGHSHSVIWLFSIPWTIACQAPLPMELPDNNTRVGRGSNPSPLHCRQILYHLSHESALLTVCVCVFVWLFATPWAVAHQAPLSMGFPRQEYWMECHFLLQGFFSNKDQIWVSCIAGRFFTIWATKEAQIFNAIGNFMTVEQAIIHW